MIGDAFRLRRERRNLSFMDMAEQYGISHKVVRRYEDGNLHETTNGAKEKLDALNMKWTREEH